MRTYLKYAAMLLVLSVASPVAAAEEQLADNLFFVKDKPGTPLHFQMIVHAGCSDEADANCRGLAHYLEHLILVGRNPEHRDAAIRLFEAGYSNGFTTPRTTIYLHRVPTAPGEAKSRLRKLFSFYAARLKNFSISPDEAKRERNIVLQEHDLRVGSQPLVKFVRDMDRRLIPDHVSGQWVIGKRDEIQNLTLADAHAFHQKWYTPNNVTFVIKGDNIEAQDVKEIAARALEGRNQGALPSRNIQRPIELRVGREDIRATDDKIRHPLVVYKKLIRLDDTNPFRQLAASFVLWRYLSGYLPGSLTATLTEAKRLTVGRPSIDIESVAPGQFRLSIIANCAPDVRPDILLSEISASVDRLSDQTVTAETLARLKKRFASNWAEESKTAERVYARLTDWFARDYSYADYLEWPTSIANLTQSDVGQFAAGLGRSGKVVTGIIQPDFEEALK